MENDLNASGEGRTDLFPFLWRPPSPLVASALDDPERGLLVLDPQLRLMHATSSLEKLLGLPKGPVPAGLDLREFLSGSDLNPASLASAECAILEAGKDKPPGPVLLFSAGSSRQIRMQVRGIGQQHLAATFTDVSANATEKASLPGAESRDMLTGLRTRWDFERAVGAVLNQAAEPALAVLMVDLDRFKPVNDTLGHAAGDAVLRLVAQRLKSVLRESDFVARLGGDEFALMIHPCTAAEVADIARRIVDLIGRTYLIDGHLVNIGASIGIALAPRDGHQYETLVRCADLALYHSKVSGRGTHHFFSAEMETRAQARRTAELDLRRALSLRQFQVYYQPQVDISTRRLSGFEALVRWLHPDRGLIAPKDFLALAEEIGVIVPIGNWVLRTACREAMKWPDHTVIAVNASPIQFETGRFAESVARALAATKLPARRLEIEVTEGILLRAEHAVLGTLRDLRSMGVRIAMDDFGTGHASLSQLARFSFDKIKIDRSLVGPDGDDVKNRAIVRAISALGLSLGIPTTAEGIETPAQLERIRLDGCGSVQGYLFGRPVPSDQLEQLVANLLPDVPDPLRSQSHTKEEHNELQLI